MRRLCVQQIAQTFWLLVEAIKSGTEPAIEKGKAAGGMYLQSLWMMAILGIILPLPFLLIGILFDWKWLISLSGIWWSGWTYLLLWAAAPIGVFIEGLTGGISGSGRRYIEWVSSVQLTGLFISLFATYFPIRENLGLVPPMCLCALILCFSNGWFFNTKVVSGIVAAILTLQTVGAYFPNTRDYVKRTIGFIDITIGIPEMVSVRLSDLKSQKTKAFGPNGEALFWYVEDQGKIVLYNLPGKRPIDGKMVDLLPLNAETYVKLLSQLEAEEQSRLAEAKEQAERERLAQTKAQEEAAKQAEAQRLELERQKVEAQKAAELAAQKQQEAEITAFRDKYLFSLPLSDVSKKAVILLVFNDKTGQKSLLLEKLEEAFKTKYPNWNIISQSFKDAFWSEKMVEKLYGSDAVLFQKLALKTMAVKVILGKISEKYTKLQEMEGMIQADIKVDFRVLSPEKGDLVSEICITRKGAGGFKIETAQAKAFESIAEEAVKKLALDSK